jgi:hypothetical protein
MFQRMLIAGLLSCITAFVSAQPASPQAPVRVRGTLEKVTPTQLVVKDRSGEVVTLARPADMPVSEVLPIRLQDIQVGSFIGSAALPQADGSQLALEVLVFPEAARGTGEGHYAWDLQPQSTMTNATVASLAVAPSQMPGGQQLLLKYKDGEKLLMVPAGTPIVTLRGAKAEENVLLIPGAKVMVVAQIKDGQPTAMRVTVGRNGFAPPM